MTTLTGTAPEPSELNTTEATRFLSAKHAPAGYNEYGSCVVPGYRIVEGPDDKARVSHQMPEPDLSDPDRPSSDDMAAERHRQVDAYAADLTGAGWTIERRGPFSRHPYFLATKGETRMTKPCSRCHGGELYDLFGHNYAGHRVANFLAQREVETQEELTALSADWLLAATGLGTKGLNLVRQKVGAKTWTVMLARGGPAEAAEEWQHGDVVLATDGQIWTRAHPDDQAQGWPWTSGADRTLSHGRPYAAEGGYPEDSPVRPLDLLVRNGLRWTA